MRWPGQLLAVLCVALLPIAHASHDSPEKVLGSWAVLSPRMHILKPAATVRELPASANPELVRRLTPDGKAFARNNFSALMIEDGAIVFEEYAQGATGVSLPVWFEGTVWKKAGAEYPTGWYLNRDGHAVAEVLVFATTRDFARVGLYVLDHLNGKMGDACMQACMKDAAHPHVAKGYWASAPSWGLGLHVGADGNTWMFGHGGQRVGINVKTSRVFAANGAKDHNFTDPDAQGLLAK